MPALKSAIHSGTCRCAQATGLSPCACRRPGGPRKRAIWKLHAWVGYTVLCLVLARLAWGVFGSPQARFSDFLRGPRGVLAYLREGRRDTPGHNPLGGWSAMTLWTLLLAQAVSGLYNSDGILFDGPLHAAVDDAVSDKLGAFHATSFNVLLAFVGLHVASIVFYQWGKKEQLLVPMIRGSAPGRAGTGPAAPVWRALLHPRSRRPRAPRHSRRRAGARLLLVVARRRARRRRRARDRPAPGRRARSRGPAA